MEFEFPEWFAGIVERAAEAYPSAIDQAWKEAEAEIREHADFPAIQDQLISYAIRRKVYVARSESNRLVKVGFNNTDQNPTKVNGLCETYQRICHEHVYGYKIGARALGDIPGKELANLAKTQFSLASGHTFNGKVLEYLAGVVPHNDTPVRKAIKEKKLYAAMKRIWLENGGDDDFEEHVSAEAGD